MIKNIREKFQQRFTRIGFILSLCGSAIGLGNIWKFPTMMASSGGSSFLFVYLVSLVIIGLPVLMCEMYLGNQTQTHPKTFFKSKKWLNPIRHLPVFSNTLLLGFYAAISGWVFMALVLSVKDLFTGTETLSYSHLTSQPVYLTLATFAFIVLTAIVCRMGVQKGIERLNTVALSVLLFILLGLLGYCASAGYLSQGLSYMFQFGEINLTFDLVTTALGHAFFTLSLGTGVVWTYGRYLARETKTPIESTTTNALLIALADTAFALMVGTIIFSILLGTGTGISGGPDLIFRALPLVFSKISGGALVEVIFFLMVFACCITSSVSMFEVMLVRNTFKNVVKLCIISFALNILTIMSLSAPEMITFFGDTFFGHSDKLLTKILMPFFGLLVVIIAITTKMKSTKAERHQTN